MGDEVYSYKGVFSRENFITHFKLVPLPICYASEKVPGTEDYRGVKYYNVPCSFDIETSSFYYNKQKASCMYIWQFGINGYVTYGRTWKEFEGFIAALIKAMHIKQFSRLVCYCHNLSFEFQWIRKRFQWYSMFARSERNPMRAVTTSGIEFRCSYVLSGCSLEQTAKDLTKYKVEKKVGDLDYRLIRSPETELKPKEFDYSIYDIVCVMNYIQEEIELWGSVAKIPLTKTSKVRRYCRSKCLSGDIGKKYRAIMASLKIHSIEEYEMLKRAFTAGFCHASYLMANEIWEDVQSYDFTSSYPSVMVCEKHPMSSGKWVKCKSLNQIRNMAKKEYYLIFNVRFVNIKEKDNIPDHYISVSRCFGCRDIKTDNGRLISAKQIETTISSDDLEIIDKCYDFDDKACIVGRCIRYKLGYLPRPFVECVLDFYKDKTTLKDIDEFIAQYSLKKGMLNSTFGCCVTDIVSDDIEYVDEWLTKEGDPETMLDEYNNSKSRFLFYPWGLSICSRARKNLWNGILAVGRDYIYSDTDSIKFINPDNHTAYFEQYNKEVDEKMRKACEINGLNYEDTRPKTVKGKVKPLGVWDDDGRYLRFKTLGAKRYLVERVNDKGEIEIKSTIAGASKKKASEYISSQKDPFEFFTDKMTIPKEYSGRLTHTYLDDEFDFELTDYTGKKYRGSEKSAVHLEESEYNLTISPIYMLLLSAKEDRAI